MTIPADKIYPRTNDSETVYLKNVITNPNITVGDYTMYNDFLSNPTQFENTIILQSEIKQHKTPQQILPACHIAEKD